MPEPGNVNIFVCCDHVIAEQGTGKQSVIGVFQNFNFVKLPSRFPAPWFIYAQINDLDAGAKTITINVVHDETQAVAFAANIEINEDHPPNVNIVLQAQAAEFTKSGKYVVTLNIGGLPSAYYVLTVNLKSTPLGGQV